MSKKISDILKKASNTLNHIKESLEKDISNFGSIIGGGTASNPTIKPSESTSQSVRDSNSNSSWFGLSEDAQKEKVNYFDNGQWKIEKIKDNGRKC